MTSVAETPPTPLYPPTNPSTFPTQDRPLPSSLIKVDFFAAAKQEKKLIGLHKVHQKMLETLSQLQAKLQTINGGQAPAFKATEILLPALAPNLSYETLMEQIVDTQQKISASLIEIAKTTIKTKEEVEFHQKALNLIQQISLQEELPQNMESSTVEHPPLQSRLKQTTRENQTKIENHVDQLANLTLFAGILLSIQSDNFISGIIMSVIASKIVRIGAPLINELSKF